MIKLRAIEPEDIDSIYTWENDPDIWESGSTHTHFSRHVLTQYILESMNSDVFSSRQLRLMVENAEKIAVGCIDMFNFDNFNHRAEVGILVDEKFRRKGYASAAVLAFCDYAKNCLQLHQLSAEVATSNTGSLRLFEKCGFVQSGLKKDWIYRNGGYEDVAVLQKIL